MKPIIIFIQNITPLRLVINIGIKNTQSMKYFLSLLTIMFFLISCEPSYRIYIHNSSSANLYIKTYPSIESILYDSTSSFYDSIISHKVKVEDKYSVYKIKPYDRILILGTIGGGPTVKELPFDYISLISFSDTIILDSKEKIIEQAKQVDKKRNFYIEIRK